MAKIIWITGTDTGVGKTFVTALLLSELRRLGAAAWAMKPFASGDRGDAVLLGRCQEGKLLEEEITPFLFRRPLAPLVAARLERRRVGFRAAVERVERLAARCEILLVEGCGGALVPLGPGYDFTDMALRLGGEVVIVAADRLGVINQTLLTVEAMQRRKLDIRAVVLSQTGAEELSQATNCGFLVEKLRPIRVLALPFMRQKGLKTGAFLRVPRVLKDFSKKLLCESGSLVGFASSIERQLRERGSEKSLKKTVDGTGKSGRLSAFLTTKD